MCEVGLCTPVHVQDLFVHYPSKSKQPQSPRVILWVRCCCCGTAPTLRHEPYNLKVDVYSFAMIIFQLFETTTPFHGHDPVDAARQAAMLGARPGFPPRRNLTPMTQVRVDAGADYCCLGQGPSLRRLSS